MVPEQTVPDTKRFTSRCRSRLTCTKTAVELSKWGKLGDRQEEAEWVTRDPISFVSILRANEWTPLHPISFLDSLWEWPPVRSLP